MIRDLLKRLREALVSSDQRQAREWDEGEFTHALRSRRVPDVTYPTCSCSSRCGDVAEADDDDRAVCKGLTR